MSMEPDFLTLTIGKQKNIALIAHDGKKAELIQWCKDNAEILKKHTEEIKKEVLADNILIGTMSGYTKEWDINGEKGMFGVEKTTD